MRTSGSSSSSNWGSCRFRCPNCKQDLPETCYCDGPLRCKTSGTLRNPGRRFVSCPNKREDQCGYFAWIDDPSESAMQRKMEELMYELEASRAECVAAKQHTRRLLRGCQCGWLFVLILLFFLLVM